MLTVNCYILWPRRLPHTISRSAYNRTLTNADPALLLSESHDTNVLYTQGMALGAPVTWSAFFLGNLLPVTLGNLVGGGFCMATVYALCYGRLQSKIGA